MPFVIIVGLPCSGKSTRSLQLKEHFSSVKDVTIVSEHSIDFPKNATYSDVQKEKNQRGVLKSNVQRQISRDKLLILDAGNYIKGFRYELYCVTKSAQTPHCVIYCDINPETASLWNSKRSCEDQYDVNVFDALVMRFESPDSKNRWDSPLFTVQPSDDLPFTEIDDALYNRIAPPPNKSTLSQPISNTNFLHALDLETQKVISFITEATKTGVHGDIIRVPGANDTICYTPKLTISALQRSRRQFISFTKTHPIDETLKIPNMFVQFLNNTLS